MKKYSFILIVFILGAVFGAGGCMLIHKYFIQNETQEVVNAVEETKVAQEEFVSGSDFAESVPLATFTPQKIDIQELKPLPAQDKQPKKEESHAFFAMFSALSIISLILAIAFGINATHSDKTRDMAVFFAISTGICLVAAFFCY